MVLNPLLEVIQNDACRQKNNGDADPGAVLGGNLTMLPVVLGAQTKEQQTKQRKNNTERVSRITEQVVEVLSYPGQAIAFAASRAL